MKNLKEKSTKAALMAVPTGIGANIGGYAGDASLAAQKIAEHIPLIVNPNVVNAAVFSGITKNMFYVEGWSMKEFVRGNIALKPSENNKIGVIFDKAVPKEILNVHINTLNAVKTVYGIDISGYEITKAQAGVSFFKTKEGISTGSVQNPETLLDAGKKLLKNGAGVIAVVCLFEEPQDDLYEKGDGVDVVGGVEAVISHFLSSELLCPCVHAPAFCDISISTKLVHPKASAEYITPTFLPCLFFGLKDAPLITKDFSGNVITNKDLHSIVMPYDCLGSSLVFDAIREGIKVYAVKENSTVLDVNSHSLGMKDVIIETKTYDDYVKIVKAKC